MTFLEEVPLEINKQLEPRSSRDFKLKHNTKGELAAHATWYPYLSSAERLLV
jgi:hypothetical protein